MSSDGWNAKTSHNFLKTNEWRDWISPRGEGILEEGYLLIKPGDDKKKGKPSRSEQE